MRLVDIWVDSHGGRAEHAQTPPAKIPYFDLLESNHRRVVVLEALGLFAPERESDSLIGLIDQLDISFRELIGQLRFRNRLP